MPVSRQAINTIHLFFSDARIYTIYMYKNIIRIVKTYLPVLAFVVFLFIGSQTASAANGKHELSGYLWSDNIGWISLNCSDRSVCSINNYKVVFDGSTGEFSGYGWSSNIGWVSFQESGGCPTIPTPTGKCKPVAIMSSSGTNGSYFPHVLGWARAVAASSMTSGAWDGWISLSCYNTSICSTSNFGAKIPNNGSSGPTAGKMSGYAWGSTAVGWVDFSGVTVTPDDTELVLESDKTEVPNIGETVTLTWKSPKNTSYTSCVASGGDTDWNGSRSTALPQSLTVTVPSDPTTFEIECDTGSKKDKASVVVDVNYVWGRSLTPDPAVVLSGGSSTLSWATSGNVPKNTVCGATPNLWTSKTTYSGSEVITNIVNGISRYYKCTPPAGSGDPITAQANVRVLSVARFTRDACYKAAAKGPTINWSAPNATQCVITDPTSDTYVVGSSGLQRFPGGAGTYSIECTAGSFSVDSTLTATQCNPDYNLVSINSCSGKAGSQTDNSFQPFGGSGAYKAVVRVESKSEHGFVSNLEYTFTKPGSWPAGITANWNNVTVNQPLYLADLELTSPNKATLDGWLGPLPNKTTTFNIGADVTPGGGNAKTGTFSVCAPDGGSSKPIFIE